MSTIEVAVAGRGIQVKQGYEKPSAGDVNTCAVSLAIESGGVWDGLPHKRVTFATRTASVTVDYAPTIAIPHEVMASPGALYLTLTGYDADGIEVARTHRMTYPIEVARAGADEGAEPAPATLDVVSRIDALAADLEEKRDTDYWRGPQGLKGDPGPQGPAGAKGEPGAPGSDAQATDVRIAGKSITVDGVADIPLAEAQNGYGLVAIDPNYGIGSNGGTLYVSQNNESGIDVRDTWVYSKFKPITGNNLDYAVKAALTDGKGAAYTDAEKLAARERMGLGGDWQLVAGITIEEESGFSIKDISVSDCMLIITVPPTQTTRIGAVVVPYAMKAGSTAKIQIQNAYISKIPVSNYEQRWAVRWYVEGGIWMGEYTGTFTDDTAAQYRRYFPYSRDVYGTSAYEYPFINEVTCAIVFPIGTKIELYGR